MSVFRRGEDAVTASSQQFEPASGTRDFLASELQRREAALSAELERRIEVARKDRSAGADAVVEVSDHKEENLVQAKKLLDDVLVEYDSTGEWARLDERAARGVRHPLHRDRRIL